ncbi:MAG TPA: substrate-binding domain-containing protein [bacterium]|nr:substrate-binding domain-containing protein [bacterium]
MRRYPGSRLRVTSVVRPWREKVGLSQGDLAAEAGVSRQTLGAIEAGRAIPGTALALRLAAALGCRVEELFHLPGAARRVTAHLAGFITDDPASQRVRLAMVGGRTVALPLTGSLAAVASLPEADGIVCGGRGPAVQVHLLTPVERLAETVVVAGCDPALPAVAAHVHRSHPRVGLAWLPVGSLQALRWLREGAAHIAGLHLRDLRTGQENVPLVRRVLGGRRTVILGFATWEEGFIVASGNPRGIHRVADLARADVTMINREKGSGARALLDMALAAGGVTPSQIRGYQREAPSHLAVAQAVALGFVDVGIGVRAAARAFGLAFVPLQRERYDLVVPAALMNHLPVQAFLDAARAQSVRHDLEAIGDYDTTRLGDTLAVLP